jgi:hypothetical protein
MSGQLASQMAQLWWSVDATQPSLPTNTALLDGHSWQRSMTSGHQHLQLNIMLAAPSRGGAHTQGFC